MSDQSFTTLLKRAQSITFVELLASVSFAMLLASIVILFEVKTAFFQRHFTPDPQVVLSPNSPRMVLSTIDVGALEQFAQEHTELAAVGVVSVDLSENTRSPLITIYGDKFVETKIATKPQISNMALFTANSSNNTEITSLLNGQFSCSPSTSSPLLIEYKMTDIIKTVCRVPVPPYYGRLTGYLVFYSRTELSIYEVDRLRRAALRLSIDMYYTNNANVQGNVSNLRKQ
jgi:hypothetical protein